jgi:uncharacterized protein
VNQTLPLNEQLLKLEQLQELDLKISQLEQRKQELPLALGELDQKLATLQEMRNEKKTLQEAAEKSHKQIQAALQLHQERAEKATAKLEGVSNPQEFQAANKEIDQLKKFSDDLEKESIQVNEKLKAFESEMGKIQEEVEKIEAERAEKASAVGAEVGKFQAELNKMLEKRNEAITGLDRRILSRYDRVRKARAGVGIVPAIEGNCTGCNMMIPPQLYNVIQQGQELKDCPSCQRILFVPQQRKETSAAEIE